VKELKELGIPYLDICHVIQWSRCSCSLTAYCGTFWARRS